MEVILREHVDNLGKRGEIVKVADGYARNYLLPRKLALPATDGNRKHVERERKIVEARESQERGAGRGARRASGRASTSHRAPRRRHRAAVRVGDVRRHRRLPEGEGLRGRQAEADPAGADQGDRRPRRAAEAAPRGHRPAQGPRRQGRRSAHIMSTQSGALSRSSQSASGSASACSLVVAAAAPESQPAAAPPAAGAAAPKGGQDQTGPVHGGRRTGRSRCRSCRATRSGRGARCRASSPRVAEPRVRPDARRAAGARASGGSAVSGRRSEPVVPGVADAVPQRLGRPGQQPGQLGQRRVERLEGQARRRRALGALPVRRRRRRATSSRAVDAVGRHLPPAAFGVHQSLRCREARLGRGRPAARRLQVHQRRQAARADAGRPRRGRHRRRRTSTGRRSWRGCPTARCT